MFSLRYEHEAPAADNIRIITPSEHDGGYSLNYEARQNANKLNQSVRTIKAYRQRIKACYVHKANGLKKEPNDTGGPNIDTKINELELAIRKEPCSIKLHLIERQLKVQFSTHKSLRKLAVTVESKLKFY